MLDFEKDIKRISELAKIVAARAGIRQDLVTFREHQTVGENPNNVGNTYDLLIAKNYKQKEKGIYGSVQVGFKGGRPFVIRDSSQFTGSGAVFYNSAAEEGLDLAGVPVGTTENEWQSAIDPMQQLGLLLGGAIHGNPGRSQKFNKDKRGINELISTALNLGVDYDVSWQYTQERRREKAGNWDNNPTTPNEFIWIPPLGVRVSENATIGSIKRIDTAYELVDVNRSNKKLMPWEESANRQELQRMANERQIPGLPIGVYALGKKEKSLVPASSFGYKNLDGSFSDDLDPTGAFASGVMKSAQQMGRETAGIGAVRGRQFREIFTPPATATLGPENTVGSLLRANLVVPLTEFIQSGYSVASTLSRTLLGGEQGLKKGEKAVATMRSKLSTTIFGINSPQDFYGIGENGEEELLLDVAKRFSPENIAKGNAIRANQRVPFMYLHGTRTDQRRVSERIGITTSEQPFGATSLFMILPEAFLNMPGIDKLVSDLSKKNIAVNFQGQDKGKEGYEIKTGMHGVIFGQMDFKNATKATVTQALEGGITGLWNYNQGGNMELGFQADANMPYKGLDLTTWSWFRGQDRSIQSKTLRSVFTNAGDRKKLKTYLETVKDQESLDLIPLSREMGVSPINLLKSITDATIGETNIFRNGVVDEKLLQKQRKIFKDLGIGRDLGWYFAGDFIDETRASYTEQTIQYIMEKNGVSREEATAMTKKALRWQQGKKLGDFQTWQLFNYGEVIKAKNATLDPTLEYRGEGRDQFEALRRNIAVQGFGDIGRGIEYKPGATQVALLDLLSASSYTKQGTGNRQGYIKVDTRKTDIERGILNQEDLRAQISSLEESGLSSVEIWNILGKSIAEKFGIEDPRLEIKNKNGSLYFGSFGSITRLDEERLAIEAEEGIGLKTGHKSLGSLPDINLSTMMEAISGEDDNVQSARKHLTKTYDKFLGSENLTKTPVGQFNPYGVSELLRPGEVFLSKEVLKRFFVQQGGDLSDKEALRKYYETYMGGALGIGWRPPGTAVGTEKNAGSTMAYSIITFNNDPRGKAIQESLDKSGMTYMDVYTAAGEEGLLGDADADFIIQTVAERMGNSKDPKKLKALLKEVVAQRTAEKQRPGLETMFAGIEGGKEKYLTRQETLINTILAGVGNSPKTLNLKRAVEDINKDFIKTMSDYNYQKNKMGSVYNSILRQTLAAGTQIGEEPEETAYDMDMLGSKIYQSATDMSYKSNTLVNILQSAFIKRVGGVYNKETGKWGGGSLGVGFVKSDTGPAEFSKRTFNLNATHGAGELSEEVMEAIIDAGDSSMTAYNLASYFGNFEHLGVKGTEAKLREEIQKTLEPDGLRIKKGMEKQSSKANLELERFLGMDQTGKSNYVARRAIAEKEALANEIQTIMDAPKSDRPSMLRTLMEKNKIGSESKFATMLGSVLALKIENKPKYVQEEFQAMSVAHPIKGAGTLNDFLHQYVPAKLIDEVLTGDKNYKGLLKIKDPKGAAEFAYEMVQSGLQNNDLVQQIIKSYVEPQGIRIETRDNVSTVMAGVKPIKTRKDLDAFIANVDKTMGEVVSSLTLETTASEQVKPTSNQVLQQTTAPGGTTPGKVNDKSYGFYDKYAVTGHTLAGQVHQFSDIVNSSFEALGNLGSIYKELYPEQLQGIDMEFLSPVKAFETVVNVMGPEAAKYPITNNPRVAADYKKLKTAKYIAGRHSKSIINPQERLIAEGLAAPDDEAAFEAAWGVGNNQNNPYPLRHGAQFIMSTMPLLEKGIKTAPVSSPPISNAEYIAKSNFVSDEVQASRLALAINPTVANARRYSIARANEATVEKEGLIKQIAAEEAVLEIDPAKRISNLNLQYDSSRLGARNTAISDIKAGILTNAEEPFRSRYSEQLIGRIEKLKGAISKEEYYANEPNTDKWKNKELKEGFLKVDVETLKKFNDELAKFVDHTKNGTEVTKDFVKEMENGTIARKLENAAIEEKKEILRQQMGELRGTGDVVTPGGMDALAREGGRGGSLVSQYRTLEQQQLTNEMKNQEVLEKESVGKTFGSAARHILGGFGLMYMRSIGNIISSGGQFGYAESMALGASLQKSVSSVLGGNAQGDYTEDNLSMAKALYSGGGQRVINRTYNNILREAPGVANVINGLTAGVGAFGASVWLGSQVLAPHMAGMSPDLTKKWNKGIETVATVIGAAVGIGSMLTNEYGKVYDQAGYIANNMGGKQAAGNWVNDLRYRFEEGIGADNEWNRQMETNKAIIAKIDQANKDVASGKYANIEEAIAKGGYTQDDKTAMAKALQFDWATSDQTISASARMQAAMQYGLMTGDVVAASNPKKLSVLESMARSIDAGIDISSSQQTFIQSLGMQYNPNRAAIVDATSLRFTTAEQASKFNTAAQFFSKLSPQLSQAAFGKTPEEVQSAIDNASKVITTTKGSPEEIKKLQEEYEKAKLINSPKGKLNKFLVGSSVGSNDIMKQLVVGVMAQGSILSPEEKERQALTKLQEAQTLVSETVANGLTPEEKWGEAISGSNGSVVLAYATAQDYAAKAGLIKGTLNLPGYMTQPMTPEKRESEMAKWGMMASTLDTLQQLSAKTGVSTLKLQGWGEALSRGTPTQQRRYASLIENPSPVSLINYASSLGPGTGIMDQIYASSINTSFGKVSLDALRYVGTNQNGIGTTGYDWGRQSFAAQGISGEQMAAKLFGTDWQSSGGAGQTMRNAMFSDIGYKFRGEVLHGEQAAEALGIQQNYNAAMAQVGIQMKGIALTGAFTTGVGLGAYAGTINPQTGQPFGIDTSGGGFWGIEDRQIALSNRQQEWQFQQQQEQMNMQNKFWQQNRSMQKKSMMMSRSYAKEDWAYQENVRDLQWGWKQEDFQENVRFMTGRERRLAERQMGRDTTMHDIEGDRIETMKKRQAEQWRLEDQRFNIEKRQHDESVRFQEDELKKNKEFYAENKKLQEEQLKLSRAYWVEQQKLQKESAGVAASQAAIAKAQAEDTLTIKLQAEATQVALNKIDTAGWLTILNKFYEVGKALGLMDPTKIVTPPAAVKTGKIGDTAKVNNYLLLDGKVVTGAIIGYVDEYIK